MRPSPPAVAEAFTNQIGVVTGMETVAAALVPSAFSTVQEHSAVPVNPGAGLNVNVPSALIVVLPLGDATRLSFRLSPASLVRSENWLLEAVLIDTFPMIVTGYASSEAAARIPTAIATGASEGALEFWMRYEKVNSLVNPVLGVNENEPSALTWREPPVPNVTVAPAALSPTAPPRLPPPNDTTSAGGDPRTSFCSRPGVVPPDASVVLSAVWNGSPGALAAAASSATAVGAAGGSPITLITA